MPRVLFFDVDGTLLSFRTHRIPESTKEALRQLHAQGDYLYVASGRAIYQLPDLLREGFEGFPGFDGFLCTSGQVCLDDRGIFRMVTVDPEAVRVLTEHAEAGEFDLLYMMGEDVFVNHRGPRVIAAAEHADLVYEEGDPDWALNSPVYQMCAFVPPADDGRIQALSDKIATTRWTDDFCDVIPSDGGKDKAVAEVLSYRGIGREDAYAFGDGGNDVTMLEAVGNGVAMGNADERARAVADHVTTSVDDDGIYRACVHYGLIEDTLGICATDPEGAQVTRV